MHFKIIFSLLIVVFSVPEAYNQDNSNEKHKYFLTDFCILAGEITQVKNTTSVEKYQKFLPQASLLKTDFSDFSSGGGGTDRNSSAILSVLASFKKVNAQHKSLRFGASIFENTYVAAYASRYVNQPLDTVTYTQTGEKFYRSRSSFRNYGMQTESINFRLDAAYIYNFFPDDRILFYSGICLGSNFSLNAHTNIYYSFEDYTRMESENGSVLFGPESYGWTDMPERINHKGNFGVNIYVPLGLDFQLTEKGDFHKTHLIYEFRPGFNGQFGGLGHYSGKQWEHKFGLKFALK